MALTGQEIEIHATDGTVLRASVEEPRGKLEGSLVLAHAMFARKTSFGREGRRGLVEAFAEKGYRTVAFDFRGHGESKAAEWTYDDLVRQDFPAVVDCVRARSEGRPVIVVGHSLGGHVAMAAQGTKRIAADAIVALGANMWLRADEGSNVRWLVKYAIARATGVLLKKGIPARKLRFGSDDEASGYTADLVRFATTNTWKARDGEDYLRSLASIDVPVAAVLGTRDRMCAPQAGAAFVRRVAGPSRVFWAPVDHAGLVKRATNEVLEALEWVRRARTPESPRR